MPPRKAAVEGNDKMALFRKGIAQVLKDDDPTVVIDPNSLTQSRPHIPSGSIVLDYLIGGKPNRFGVAPCPGWPKGAISNVYGHESSGKTTLALMAAANVIRAGGTVVYVDWENAIDLSYAEALGVPVTNAKSWTLVQPRTLEAGFKAAWAACKMGVDLVILDSVGTGLPESVVNQSLEEQGKATRVGILAQFWSTALPKLSPILVETGTHLMGISQLRKKIDTHSAYAEQSTVQGGEIWKFASAVRVKLQKVFSEKGKEYDPITHKMVEQVTAIKVKAKIDKSKVSDSQQHEAEYWITFGAGVDDFRSVIEICTAHGIIKKGGAWYTWDRNDGSQVRGQGNTDFRNKLNSLPGAIEELTQSAKAKIIEVSGTGIPATTPEEDSVDLDDDLEAVMASISSAG